MSSLIKVDALREQYMATSAESASRRFERVQKICESPIEKLFAAQLFVYGYTETDDYESSGIEWIDHDLDDYDWIARLGIVVLSDWTRHDDPEDEVVIVPQAPVRMADGTKYRLDFAFTNEHHKVKLAVELDGHEFHEKTKEQAAKDRARERRLILNGWLVVRFTGSEIYADARKCVSEVARVIRKQMPTHLWIPPEHAAQ